MVAKDTSGLQVDPAVMAGFAQSLTGAAESCRDGWTNSTVRSAKCWVGASCHYAASLVAIGKTDYVEAY